VSARHPVGLPSRIAIPVLVTIAVILIALVVWLLRTGVGESGSIVAPSSAVSPGAPTPAASPDQ